MPDDYIVPNFATKRVSEVEGSVPDGIGVRVKKDGDDAFHDPSSAEENMVVEANGPNSSPGTSKEVGGWVGVKIKPV
jgi:hypothetical protein